MINLLLLLVFLTCIGITAAWVAENPGNVTIHWFDYRIDTSFAFLLVLLLVSAVVLAYAYTLIRRIVLAPEYVSNRRSLKRYKKGLTELTYSVAALAAADNKGAQLHTRKAEKLLGRTPITLLLSAQIARSHGDEDKTRMLLTQMLEHPETEYLAARSLSDVATKQQMLPNALTLAERAHALNAGSLAPVLSLQLRLGLWQQGMIAIDKTVRKGKITRSEMRHYKGILYVQQGKQLLEAGQKEAALAAAKQALKQLPYFVPCVLFAAKAFAANGQQGKAISLLFRAQDKTPHAQLAEALRNAIAREPENKQAKLRKKLAATAQSDATHSSWICSACGHATREWDAHCPNCAAFDTLEWKQRDLAFVD